MGIKLNVRASYSTMWLHAEGHYLAPIEEFMRHLIAAFDTLCKLWIDAVTQRLSILHHRDPDMNEVCHSRRKPAKRSASDQAATLASNIISRPSLFTGAV